MSAHLVIERPGLASTLQDFGRFGYQRFGISASGAMDLDAMRIANALAGNPPDKVVIEMAMTGLSATVVGGPCRLALAGATMPVSVNGRAVASWRAYALEDGDRIDIGAATDGVYACLAVAGGLAVAPTLGSLSTHTRSSIGGFEGRALRPGDRLPLAATSLAAGPILGLAEADRPRRTGPIRVVLGPQDDHFTAAGIETFLSAGFRVSPRADRMGMQLEGPAIEHGAGFNIISDGIANGSIQVPGHGAPLVLLADRQTTGGYPKIATVIGPDLPRVAQSRPGETIRFTAIDRHEAEAEARRHRQTIDAAIARIRPLAFGTEDLTTADLLAANLIGGVCSAFDTLDRATDDTATGATPLTSPGEDR